MSKELQLMLVVWIDARWSSETWAIDELKDFELALIHSVGWGIQFADKIVLVTEYYPEMDHQHENCRRIYAIPISCVKEVKYLERINPEAQNH